MDTLYWLNRIQAEQYSLVGEQAGHLSVLAKKGYPVLPSVMISSHQFRDFLATINWLEPFFSDLPTSSLRLNVEDPQQLQAIARQIRQTIQQAALPASWVRQLEAAVQEFPCLSATSEQQAVILRPSLTYQSPNAKGIALNLGAEVTSLIDPQVCWAKAESLAIALKTLWADLFRARNLVYWQRSQTFLEHLHVAVLVQPIASAIATGSLSLSPTGWQVLATQGLEIATITGEALPTHYQIAPDQDSLVAQQRGSQAIVYEIASPSPPRADRAAPVPLERRLLPELDQQQTEVLNADALEPFLTLTTQLAADYRSPWILEWQLYPAHPDRPQLYLTQIRYQDVFPAAPQESAELSAFQREQRALDGSPTLRPIVTGLAASAGYTVAVAQVIADLRTYDPNDPTQSVPLAAGTALVTSSLMPDALPLIQTVSAIITEQGGMTCHGAIVARELGIPAVIGAAQATQSIQTGDHLLIDGRSGTVYRLEPIPTQNKYPIDPPIPPSATERVEPSSRSVIAPLRLGLPSASQLSASQLSASQFSRSTLPASPLLYPSSHQHPLPQLMVNLSQLETLERVVKLGVDGIGLLRSELMLLALLENQHPQRWFSQGRQQELSDRLAAQIQRFAAAFSPKPVFYRTLDWRSHEFQRLQGSPVYPPEMNPMLGIRGAFRYQLHPELFQLELTALHQAIAAGYANLRLVLPFVRTVEEFTFCAQHIQQVGLKQWPEFECWMMAEVPSALFLLPDYVQAGVQGICIGTSDLTQLILGVDRDQQALAEVFNEHHPAVLGAISQLILTARQLGIPCSLSTQAQLANHFVDRLVECGVTAISVNWDQVASVGQAIAQAEHWIRRSRDINQGM